MYIHIYIDIYIYRHIYVCPLCTTKTGRIILFVSLRSGTYELSLSGRVYEEFMNTFIFTKYVYVCGTIDYKI